MELPDLLQRSWSELDDLFRGAPAGPLPSGDTTGMAIAWPGTRWARPFARFVAVCAWQGKVFTLAEGGNEARLANKITPAGLKRIVARVYHAKSWLDGGDCIVLDYSKTSLVARRIRDEIRLIDAERRIYLGLVWWGRTRLLGFALQLPPQGHDSH